MYTLKHMSKEDLQRRIQTSQQSVDRMQSEGRTGLLLELKQQEVETYSKELARRVRKGGQT